MNVHRPKGGWKQLKGKLREQWGELSDEDLDLLEGRREALAGSRHKRSGLGGDEIDGRAGGIEDREAMA